MTGHTTPFALNPIQWYASDDGWLDFSRTFEPRELLSQIKEAGFDAVFADVPSGWTVDDYRALLDDLELAPATGYFVFGSGEGSDHTDVLDRVAAAARTHAALGLTDILIGGGMSKDAPRVVHPARGYGADPARLERVTELVAKIAETTLAEGVRASLHPHIGTAIETEEEARAVLDAIDERLLGFGPDTGHLTWAGADVRRLIDDYGTRVGGVHVKDCRLSVAASARQKNLTYQQTVMNGLWVEPGRGELDLEAMLAALPADFAGFLIVEVDRPDIRDPFESAKASAAWMREHHPVVT